MTFKKKKFFHVRGTNIIINLLYGKKQTDNNFYKNNDTFETNFTRHDNYSGSTTHAKVILREVLHPIELKLGNVDFWGGENRKKPGRNVSELSEEPTTNLTIIWPCVRNRTQTALVGGECNQHNAIPAPLRMA